jgi:hypothetical protein
MIAANEPGRINGQKLKYLLIGPLSLQIHFYFHYYEFALPFFAWIMGKQQLTAPQTFFLKSQQP